MTERAESYGDAGLCPTTGKRSYTSRSRAKRATARVSNRIRVYPCPACHGWHVTSQIHRDRPWS